MSHVTQHSSASLDVYYFYEYFCENTGWYNGGINSNKHVIKDLACNPSIRASYVPNRLVAVPEDRLPIGGGNVCKLDPGNTYHFVVNHGLRKNNFAEIHNCCVPNTCCAFCIEGQNNLGINELPVPWWGYKNCTNCYDAVMTYFSSMSMDIAGYTIPNVCWASEVACEDLHHPSSSWGCSCNSDGGYRVMPSQSGGSP